MGRLWKQIVAPLHPSRVGRRAFTLVELLVSLGVLGFLVGLILPGLTKARRQAAGTYCQSGLRQIALVNEMYAREQRGHFVPGAADFLRNRHRWHGTRASLQAPFEGGDGPLRDYLGPGGDIRRCPALEVDKPGFEAGCGGYGYNNAYVGVVGLTDRQGRFLVLSDRAGTVADRIRRPAETLMFADAAFVNGELIEYSFAEPRFHPRFQGRADPSIHFRHLRRANVAWCDGHVSAESPTFYWKSGFYEGDPADFEVGWFGEGDDNSDFDLD